MLPRWTRRDFLLVQTIRQVRSRAGMGETSMPSELRNKLVQKDCMPE